MSEAIEKVLHRIFTDGSGDGRMAWYNETTGEHWSGRQAGLTNNEAEYLAVYNALKSAKTKNIEILSDSKLVINQLKRNWHIKNDRMRKLFDQIQKVIQDRDLKVTFRWVARRNNPAGKYLG